MSTEQIVVLDAGSVGDDFTWPDFSSLGQFTSYDNTKPEEVLSRVRDATIILTNKVVLTQTVIEQCPNLRYIGTIATGYNQVDISTAKSRGIYVCNVPDYSTSAVVQLVFGLLLTLSCRIDLHAQAVRDGEWAQSEHFCFWKSPVTELEGKTLGIVGFGNIGRGVAQVGHCFGMNIIAYAPRPKPIPPYSPFAFVGLDELFSSADAISLHCPLTPENTGMVNAERLNTMKQTAFLLNCARGPLVNEQDLAVALNSGRIAGAGLDVVSQEPMPNGNPLRTAKNCIITPHIGWCSVEARTRLMQGVFTNVKNFLAGQPTHVVNDL